FKNAGAGRRRRRCSTALGRASGAATVHLQRRQLSCCCRTKDEEERSLGRSDRRRRLLGVRRGEGKRRVEGRWCHHDGGRAEDARSVASLGNEERRSFIGRARRSRSCRSCCGRGFSAQTRRSRHSRWRSARRHAVKGEAAADGRYRLGGRRGEQLGGLQQPVRLVEAPRISAKRPACRLRGIYADGGTRSIQTGQKERR
ncbi:unnamed protein product, partial [Phaeothamnion confervicola]